jgi:hypothetical protein
MGEKALVHVDADNLAALADTPCHQIGNAARPAADIEAGPAFANADPLEHDIGVRRHRRALHMQALDLSRPALDRIIPRELPAHDVP